MFRAQASFVALSFDYFIFCAVLNVAHVSVEQQQQQQQQQLNQASHSLFLKFLRFQVRKSSSSKSRSVVLANYEKPQL